MTIDAYAACPCGSGKKVKWCCGPFLQQVQQALELEQEGQHESAQAVFRQLLNSYGSSAAIWIYYAEFLLKSGRTQEAEEAIEQALRRDPQAAAAYHLRATLREQEGELIGALILYHKAAELFTPDARDLLLETLLKIFQLEMLLNRPVTARFALDRALHLRPELPELHQLFEGTFGEPSVLPLAARRAYRFRPTRRAVAVTQPSGRLGEARQAYEQLVQQTPDDPAAWFNLGLVRAWMGEQPRAVEALYHSLDLETNDHLAEETGTLLEVLLCANGMEDQANYLRHVYEWNVRDPNALLAWLRHGHEQRRIVALEVDEGHQAIRGVLVEELRSLIVAGREPLYRLLGHLMIYGGQLRVSSVHPDTAATLAAQVREQLGLAVEPVGSLVQYVAFFDVVSEAVLISPERRYEQELERVQAYVRDYFETVWLHRPLKSLDGNTPLDAMGSARLRKRVFGAVKFLEECWLTQVPHREINGQRVPLPVYDFASLRHKLGLEYTVPPAEVTAGPGPALEPGMAPSPETPLGSAPLPGSARPSRDISGLNAAELSALNVQELNVEELEQAMRAALRLDARELAVHFARAGLDKPYDPSRPDRYPLFAAAITGAMVQGDYPQALQLIERGERYDAEHNRNERAIDYALKRANIYVRMKDVNKAVEAFEKLIAEHPDEGRLYTTAAEEMLRLRAFDKAKEFAEQGLRQAHRSQNRDLEEHCRELLAAAGKVG